MGQSENIVVKNSLAFGNVAGIEIENCDNAEVFGNTARDNAGGILVFNLPGLPKSDGKGTKIYDNDVIDNNHENFATPLGDGPNGNTVTMIPPGSGIVLLAAKEVEVFGNRILRNKTTGIASQAIRSPDSRQRLQIGLLTLLTSMSMTIITSEIGINSRTSHENWESWFWYIMLMDLAKVKISSTMGFGTKNRVQPST